MPFPSDYEGNVEYYVSTPTAQYILEAIGLSHFNGSTAQYLSFVISFLLASAGKQNRLSDKEESSKSQPELSTTDPTGNEDQMAVEPPKVRN